jgi:hypothetical protein
MRWLLAALFATLALASTDPKPKAEDYPVHGRAGETAIGAEYMVRSFSGGEATYIADRYLVVEVALYPPKDKTVQPEAGQFSLRINGKKQTISPQPASMVAASLQHPEWRQDPGTQVGIGLGDTGITLGGPPRNDRPFPNAPPVSRLPNPPRLPEPDPPSGVEKQPKVKPEELVVQIALEEGLHHRPVSGFLYFPYSGKISSIKTLELQYQDAVLKLK